MSTPNPRPAPGPAPKRHPSGKGYVPSDDTKKNPDDVENKKKIAIDHVVSTFNSARADIGADYDHTRSLTGPSPILSQTDIRRRSKISRKTIP